MLMPFVLSLHLPLCLTHGQIPPHPKPRTSEAPPQTDEACRPRRVLTLEVDSGRCSSRGAKPP